MFAEGRRWCEGTEICRPSWRGQNIGTPPALGIVLDSTHHRKVIGNDRQTSRDVPIQLELSDGESPQEPEVFQGSPRVAVVRDGPPILSRGRRFKSCPATTLNCRSGPGSWVTQTRSLRLMSAGSLLTLPRDGGRRRAPAAKDGEAWRRVAKSGEEWRKFDMCDLFANDPEVIKLALGSFIMCGGVTSGRNGSSWSGSRLDLITRLGVGIPGITLLRLMRAGTALLKLCTCP